MKDILGLVLSARAKRGDIRKNLALQKLPSVSLSLNIPGYPKSDKTIAVFFATVLVQLKRYLKAQRIFLDEIKSLSQTDEAGDFFIVPLTVDSSLKHSVERVKEICQSFEGEHPLGRLIDVDITDRNGQAVSSGKMKGCFICEDRAAVQCMKEETHSKEELRDYIFNAIEQYLNKDTEKSVCRRLTTLATQAMLYEISLAPKPGAVDRLNCGSHEDMDYFTFLNSSAVISSYFNELATAGYCFNASKDQILPTIRMIGLEMEEQMFKATGSVNTQKGIIFLFGLTLFHAAWVIAQIGYFDLEIFIENLKQSTRGLVANELPTPSMEPAGGTTHGEICAQRYGLQLGGGIRREVEQGLPTVISYGLNVLKEHVIAQDVWLKEIDSKEPLMRTLLSLMSVNNDTNILFRKGPEQLEKVKSLALAVLKESGAEAREKKYRHLVGYCLKEHISPGGSSDLLAVTILIYFIELEFPSKPSAQSSKANTVASYEF
jgi:holo-ACP synthase CitX